MHSRRMPDSMKAIATSPRYDRAKINGADGITVGPDVSSARSCVPDHDLRRGPLALVWGGGPPPAPRPRSKFADFPPPAAEPLARFSGAGRDPPLVREV